MSILVIALVGCCIAIGFYFLNKDSARDKTKLRESTAMVFLLSTGVLLLAKFMGIGGPPPVSKGGGAVDSGARQSVALDYMLAGEPPF